MELKANYDYNIDASTLLFLSLADDNNARKLEILEMIKDKSVIITETALKCFKPDEYKPNFDILKANAEKLLQKFMVVKDNPSEQFRKIGERYHCKSLNERNLIIFGTGDRYNAITITSNLKFVRNIIKYCAVKISGPLSHALNTSTNTNIITSFPKRTKTIEYPILNIYLFDYNLKK